MPSLSQSDPSPLRDGASDVSRPPLTILITGASRGIGRAAAIACAEEGNNLILTCRHSAEQLRNLAEELQNVYGVSCRTFVGDMGNPEDVERLYADIRRLDVLVNNAGVSYIGLLSEMSVEKWREIMDTNLNSVFYASRLAIPLMLPGHFGRIINVSSVWGSVGASMESAYSTSKGGVNSFTKALAKELAPSNIQVNAVACGLIDTDMNHCFTAQELEQLCREIPADRMGRPEEAAALILQLIHAPSYLTGQIIALDGGFT